MNPQERKIKANKILFDMGLCERLAQIGKPHVIGNYWMDMMAWNDLDIDIENQHMSKEKLYDLTSYILNTFQPLWYEAKEEVNDEETIEKAEKYCDKIADMSSKQPGSRDIILKMKQELIELNQYGFYQYASMDVYRAVLEQGIKSTKDLLEKYVKQENRL